MTTEFIEHNPRQIQVGFYSDFYTKNKSDSPDTSRASLLRRASSYMIGFGQGDFVLELGSGRQIVTREYLRDRKARPAFTIVTLDIADITHKQLLARDSSAVSHVRADGGRTPFQSGAFSLVISNMALDFMGEEAISELYRVLKPGAKAEVNLHHRNLIPPDLDGLLSNKKRGLPKSERIVLEYWRYLRDKDILTSDPDVLRERFIKYGLYVEKLVEAHDSHDTWWEVSLRRAGATFNPVSFIYHPDLTKDEVLKILTQAQGVATDNNANEPQLPRGFDPIDVNFGGGKPYQDINDARAAVIRLWPRILSD